MPCNALKTILGFNFFSFSAKYPLASKFITLYPYSTRPQGHVVRDLNPDVTEVEDIDGDMVCWFKKACKTSQPIALLRPDKFTFAVVDQNEINSVIQQLKHQLGICPSDLTLKTSKEVAV